MIKNILVTGGAGFIGSHLADHLLAQGRRVRVLDNLCNGSLRNLSGASSSPSFEFVEGDVRRVQDCSKACDGMDAVIHLACLGVRHSLHSPRQNHETNAGGTLNVLEAARRRKIAHFVYVSSSEIYGKVTRFPITEDVVPIPITVYGSSKLAGEHYTLSYKHCYGLNATVLRIFNNYGPRAHHEGDAGEMIPRSIVSLLRGQSPVIFGDGSVTRDFYYVKDTAAVIAELTDRLDLAGDVINVGSGREISMRQLLDRIRLLMGKASIPIVHLPDRPADVPRLWVDPRKMSRLVKSVRPQDFEQGLKDCISYYKELGAERDLLAEMEKFNWMKK